MNTRIDEFIAQAGIEEPVHGMYSCTREQLLELSATATVSVLHGGELSYEVYVDGEYFAGVDDEEEAQHYMMVAEGDAEESIELVEVYTVRRSIVKGVRDLDAEAA